MRHASLRQALLAGFLALAPPASGAPPETPDEIRACIEANRPEASSVQTVLLRAVDGHGEATTTRATISWKRFDDGRSRVLMEVTEPPTRRGSMLLAIEKEKGTDLFVYLPELRRVKRVSRHAFSGSVFGTDLSYEDFERLQNLAENLETTRLPDRTHEGRPVYALESRPTAEAQSEYARIVSLVDRETCLVLRAEFYGSDGRTLKVFSSEREQATREAFGWVPRLVRVEDPVDETHTEVVLESIEADPVLADEVFSAGRLERRGR